MPFYHIDEQTARLAHTMNSQRDYKPNSTTREYTAMVEEAAEIARQEIEKRPDSAEDINRLLDRYARKLAEWFNKNSRIEAMCPSWLVSGGSNFPVRKKEKQNAARHNHMQEWSEIEALKNKLRGIGTGGIQSNDARALEKLKDKLEGLEEAQEAMKAANAYFREHNTLDGFSGLSLEAIEELKERMTRPYWLGGSPFAGYQLTNNSANIRRVKERLETLEKAKAQDKTERVTAVEGVKVIEDPELMRIQLVFDGKPAPEIRDVLKAYGFRWAPSQSAWQRQLNGNGQYAARQVLEKLAAQR